MNCELVQLQNNTNKGRFISPLLLCVFFISVGFFQT